MDDRLSSEQYRDDSLLERQRSQEIYNDYTPSAVEYAHDNGISLDQAYNHVLAQAGHDVEEVKWTRVPLNETDTPVGAEIQGKNISVVCNSIITEGLVNFVLSCLLFNEISISILLYESIFKSLLIVLYVIGPVYD